MQSILICDSSHIKPVCVLSLVLDLLHSSAATLDQICASFLSTQLTQIARHLASGLSRQCLVQIEVEAMPEEETLRKAGEEKIKAGLKDVGSLRLVQGRGLITGDVAVIDIDLRRKESGEIIEGSQQTGKQIDTATAQHTVELPGLFRSSHRLE